MEFYFYGHFQHYLYKDFSIQLSLQLRYSDERILKRVLFQIQINWNAFLNFLQYDSFAWIPAAPAALCSPLPGSDGQEVNKESITIKQIVKTLPNSKIAVAQLAETFVLSRYSANEEFLGVFVEEWFVDDEAKAAQISFKQDLAKLKEIVEQRKDWPRMLPEYIPNSTAI